MKLIKWALRVLKYALALVGVLIVCGIVLLSLPINEIANDIPVGKDEMKRVTLLWGRLAPFPSTAKDFTILESGSMFTREFGGSFTDSPEAIAEWLKASPGAQEGEMTKKEDGSTYYLLKPGDGAQFGEVIISPDHANVTFRVYWS